MRLQVVLADRAKRQLDSAVRWWAENRSPAQAERWYNGFLKAMQGLSRNPQRCPKSPESPRLLMETRDLYYGLGRRKTHRAVFTIRSDMVLVLAIRHLAQDELTPDDIV
jgi:plasmid stabilization system protein ParE